LTHRLQRAGFASWVSATEVSVTKQQLRACISSLSPEKRSMLKAISWRAVGTIDTILVSYFWTGDTSKALKIGGTDVLTKILLYYLHERVWARVPLGTIRRILDRDPDSTPGAESQPGVK
jgi:uncharacterized membrane protein